MSGPEEQQKSAMDVLNYAWTIICNVNEGDWTKQRQEWQDAAAKCREQYHALLASSEPSDKEIEVEPWTEQQLESIRRLRP